MNGRVGIIGAGWYGAHIALVLTKKYGLDVTLFEKNADIFCGISGEFGKRLHAGPHYPRSKQTRDVCHQDFEEFYATYPELIEENEHSIYALGTTDADGDPSKVDQTTFEAVCSEFKSTGKIDAEGWGYKNIITAFDLKEPSITIGDRLRNFFKQKLKAAGVNIVCNTEVKDIHRNHENAFFLTTNSDEKIGAFDRIINTTSFQALLPMDKPLPLGLKVKYQPCVGLVYKDKEATSLPFQLIFMDGWFPCMMPRSGPVQIGNKLEQDYYLTHGKWTILGSYDTAEEANARLANTNDEFIKTHVQLKCEYQMNRFWPQFKSRFEYCGWKGNTLAKIVSNGEFRSAVTVQNVNDGIIYVIPGKVSNIFEAEREVADLMYDKNTIHHLDGYRYVVGGTLDGALHEIQQKITDKNTCALQPYQEEFETASSNQDTPQRTNISGQRLSISTCSTVTDSPPSSPRTPTTPRFFGSASSTPSSSSPPSPPLKSRDKEKESSVRRVLFPSLENTTKQQKFTTPENNGNIADKSHEVGTTRRSLTSRFLLTQ